MQKRAKLEKKGCVFGHTDKSWKGHDGQIKKNTCKNTYLGSIFIHEKYVFRVCFESPFTRMISSLKYKWPLGIFTVAMVSSMEIAISHCTRYELNRPSEFYLERQSFSTFGLRTTRGPRDNFMQPAKEQN